MNQIKYDFGAISTTSADIQSTAARINTMLADLKSLIQPMVSTWEGESATAYAQAQAKWDEAAEDLNVVLGTIAKTVANGNDRMSDVNRRAAASWG